MKVPFGLNTPVHLPLRTLAMEDRKVKEAKANHNLRVVAELRGLQREGAEKVPQARGCRQGTESEDGGERDDTGDNDSDRDSADSDQP